MVGAHYSLLALRGCMLYVFHGPDEFMRSEAVQDLVRQVLPADLAEVNTTRLDGSATTMEEVRFVCEAIPFFAPGRVVVAEGLVARAAKDKELARCLADFAPRVPAQTHLVLSDREPPPTGAPLGPALRAHARARAFPLLSGRELARWVQERAQREGGSFLPAAADQLISYVGNNSRLLLHEIRKLVAYTGGTRSINESDVALLVSQALQANVWRFVDAVGFGQQKHALEQLHALLGPGQRPESVLGMVARQARLLLQARALLEQGTGEREIGSALNLPQFALHRILEQARRWRLSQLEAMHRRVLAADVQIKTGELDAPLALDLLVVELCDGAATTQPAPRPLRR